MFIKIAEKVQSLESNKDFEIFLNKMKEVWFQLIKSNDIIEIYAKRKSYSYRAGFIGSHIVDLLVAEGYEVHVIDNLHTGKVEDINKEAIFHEIDIKRDSYFQFLR